MAKETENKSLTEEEIRVKIEAEVRAEYEEKLKTAAAKIEKEAEEKISKAEASAEKEFVKQERNVKDMLAKEKKVKIFIPENPLNPNEVVPVGLNGVIYAIPVGQEFEVPESIYNIWKYSYDMTRAANKKMEAVLTKEIKIL